MHKVLEVVTIVPFDIVLKNNATLKVAQQFMAQNGSLTITM
ncbi:hypothetical protein [Candidatus Anaplasma sp. TIGMIC]|nr:hypothetical protein [Candidatus Anaplasma sp. TIGMIC]